MADLREIPCSICGCSQVRIVGKPMDISLEARQVVSRCDEVRIVQCKECGFYYTAPMLFWSSHDLHILYSAEYFPKPTSWWTGQRMVDAHSRLRLLGQIAKSSEPVFLDVGCGYGHVLERAVELGWKSYGLEPSPALAAQARERVGKLAAIRIESLEKTTFPSSFFDAIHMDSVLEHLPNPKSAVEVLHRLLKGGGVAYILVPNEDRLAYLPSEVLLWLKQRYGETPRLSPLQNPYHIVGFNEGSFCRLFKESGFHAKYYRVFRGDDPWKKVETASDGMNLKGKIFRVSESLFWALGGRLGRGAYIEAVWEKK